MDMIEVKTEGLFGPALDWAVAKAEGVDVDIDREFGVVSESSINITGRWSPSTDWSQGGPLIEKYRICFIVNSFPELDEGWLAVNQEGDAAATGSTHLIAACRSIVAAKLGDVVQVPAVLVSTVDQP